MPRNKAINPSSLEGGDMSILKNASEIATIKRMPNARRVNMGRRERDSFIDFYYVFARNDITAQTYSQLPTQSISARVGMGRVRSFHADGAHAPLPYQDQYIARHPRSAQAIAHA